MKHVRWHNILTALAVALVAVALSFAAPLPAMADDKDSFLDKLSDLLDPAEPAEETAPEIVFGQAKQTAEGVSIPFDLSVGTDGSMSIEVRDAALSPYIGKAVRVRIPGMAEQRMNVGTVLDNGVRLGTLKLRLPLADARGSVIVFGAELASANALPATRTLSAAPAPAAQLMGATPAADTGAAPSEESDGHACNCSCAACNPAGGEDLSPYDAAAQADYGAPAPSAWNGVVPPRTPDVFGSEYYGRSGGSGRSVLPATGDPTSLVMSFNCLVGSVASFALAALARKEER